MLCLEVRKMKNKKRFTTEEIVKILRGEDKPKKEVKK